MGIADISMPTFGFSGHDFVSRARQFFGNSDMAMDLGTANTLIYVRQKGIVLNEPSVIAVDEESGVPVAIGHQAKRIFGKTSRAVRCVRPMKDGVIADPSMTAMMINHMLSQVRSAWQIRKPRLVIGVPSGITQAEKLAVIEAALASGVRQVKLVEESIAAALGAGLPIDSPIGNMIVDIGGGTTEVAVLSMGGAIYSQSVRVAGDEMDEAIAREIRRSHSAEIGIFEAERIKLIIGSAVNVTSGAVSESLAVNDDQSPCSRLASGRSMITYGRDITTGIPKKITIDEHMVNVALQEPMEAIVSAIGTALEQISPELANDIAMRGVYLAGGGSLLRGLAERLSTELNIRCLRVQDPLSCVVRGVGQVIEDLRRMSVFCIA